MFSSFKVAENHQVSMLQCCWMFHTESFVSQRLESLKSLAAVFEINVSELQQESDMGNDVKV
ncbi:hypothetical protein, partial [Vibrio cholerae]|uniref:hypothetical protein n=1 Tax=Vibrio cholerae TaxID=666 RepID=UPI001C8DA98C